MLALAQACPPALAQLRPARAAAALGDDEATVVAALPVAQAPRRRAVALHYLDRLSLGPRHLVQRATLAGPGGFSRVVVVKQLCPTLAGAPGAERALRQEGAVLARLQSPHVVRLLDRIEGADGPQLVLEELPGADLLDMLASGPLPLRAGLELLAGVARGLAAIHAARDLAGARMGLCHGGLRAENVRVCPAGRVVLTGLSGARATAAHHTEDDGLLFDIETDPQGAPVVGVPTPAGDLWALGELFTAVLLPGGADLSRRSPLHQLGGRDALVRLHPAVAALQDRLWSAAPGRRPPAIDVARALGAVAATVAGPRLADLPLPGRTARVAAPLTSPHRPPRARPLQAEAAELDLVDPAGPEGLHGARIPARGLVRPLSAAADPRVIAAVGAGLRAAAAGLLPPATRPAPAPAWAARVAAAVGWIAVLGGALVTAAGAVRLGAGLP
jgi:hypothetical protein